jgi:hypothetical protein
MRTPMKLAGRTALVTGASRGIGRAYVADDAPGVLDRVGIEVDVGVVLEAPVHVRGVDGTRRLRPAVILADWRFTGERP